MTVLDVLDEVIPVDPLPELEPAPALPELEPVTLTKRQQAKHDGGFIRVRDSIDTDGDTVYHLHLETYDRRVLTDLAERNGLRLVFVTEYHDYEREEG